mmetsp:Transcript_998/g.1567  ORF Transcript_998/g.1567 Transcript_998/m.1567 type:complete len:99 (-) Transcript_998:58-354(-)
MTLKLTTETIKMMEEDGDSLIFPSRSEQDINFSPDVQPKGKGSFLMQKVTKFEGILIQKVFFSNKNIYGNLMLSTCRQVKRDVNGAENSSQSSLNEGP